MTTKPIMPLQDLFALQDRVLLHRLETLLPRVMEETGTDMWIVVGDEYNEGPTVRSLLPSSFFHARRTALFVFARDHAGGVTRSIVSKPDFSIARFYTPALLKPRGFDYERFYTTFAPDYDLEAIRALPEEDMWECLARLVREHDPATIAVETSSLTPFADGLTKTNWDHLITALDPRYHDRIRSSERLTLRWLETRSDEEIPLFREVIRATRRIIARCYSREVITAGQTTLGEARFFLMEEGIRLGMEPWFDATVWARRAGNAHLDGDDEVIQPGDLLHCDVGFRYGGLCSDVQEMAYVNDPRNPANERVIADLTRIHHTAMEFQDIVAAHMRAGLTGNEVLTRSLATAKERGIARPMLYSHPIGTFGHGPGPTIGSFGNQEHVDGLGEYPLHDRTAYALELNVREEVPAWDNLVVMYGQEIDVLLRDGELSYPGDRQRELHIIGASFKM